MAVTEPEPEPEPVGWWAPLHSTPRSEQVRPDMQGRGIASALAAAAEARLAAAGCHSVQIEYEYLGDAYSDRLFLWYESSAGFHCSQGKPRAGCHQFRRCRKRLEPAPGEKGSAAASLPRVLPLCQLM
mmetsp:Transcript_31563/g.94320  ORF Transcript_31563/g.94320 Transcript_31563/m.94320 type:complete len:128 (+) Transcript_31563:318-701(+)